MIKVITVGKKSEQHIQTGINEYQKRLSKAFTIDWVLLSKSGKPVSEAVREESRNILKVVKPSDFVVLLDEAGENIDSPTLSKLVSEKVENSTQVVFIIGGAYGVDDSVKARANFVWSLSKLVFPHQIVRLVITEQIYRAQEIYLGHPYHHQ